MCGIAGVVGIGVADAERAVAAMCTHMIPRGPDGEGISVLARGQRPVVLGARRLAIIDPTPAGHQPMSDPGRDTTIVFNGMIYNFRELRRELEASGERFRSDCDTEVVLRAYGVWGSEAVTRLRGMFAFAIWDDRTRALLLVRDRLGIKPLYYTDVEGGRIAFASQVKTLVASGLVEPRLSQAGIQSFLSFGAVSEPMTILEGVHAIPAGHVGRLAGERFSVKRYWEPAVSTASAPPTAEAAEQELRELLAQTVRAHLVSDAPIGVFLSGGLDSSLVAAMAAEASADVGTVSVEFAEKAFSERPHIRGVAESLGSRHTSIELEPNQLMSWLPAVFEAMDQPTFDGVNTYVVSRAASEAGLKVAVSGLGADELFDGYGYTTRLRALKALSAIPSAAAPVVRRVTRDAARAAKIEHWLTTPKNERDGYELLRRVFLPDDVARLAGPPVDTGPPIRWSVDGDAYRQLSCRDLENYTRNILLRDTDCMSMANSVEVRVPYLDHPFVEFALSLRSELKGRRKRLLKRVACGRVPSNILSRRKRGFVLPLGLWMRDGSAVEVIGLRSSLPPLLEERLELSEANNVWKDYNEGGRSWFAPWALWVLVQWTESLNQVERMMIEPTSLIKRGP